MIAKTLGTLFILITLSLCCYAQEAKKPEPDTLVFNNGERLMGKLLRSSGAAVTFHSDSLGDITVDWSKVKELKAAGEYAVIGKGTDLKRVEMDAVPQGKVSVTDQKIEVSKKAGGTATIPVSESGQIVDETLFNSALTDHPGFFQKWIGTAGAGASLVQATQASRTYNGAINLVRALPSETFLERQSRSTVNITGAFGETRQPGTENVKTEILHGDAEHDIYFSPRAYGFGQASFDHNFSQGLDLQQTYGIGIGWTVVKRPNEELNIKASGGFERQQFAAATNQPMNPGASSQNLFSSIFADTYLRKLGKAHAMIFQQQLQISPAWTNLNAYSAVGSASLAVPVYRRMNFTIGVTDNFVNNPPLGFKKNSFQATTGISYVLK